MRCKSSRRTAQAEGRYALRSAYFSAGRSTSSTYIACPPYELLPDLERIDFLFPFWERIDFSWAKKKDPLNLATISLNNV